MDDYYKEINDYYENSACSLLNKTCHLRNNGLIARRNNLESNGIDILVGKDGNPPFLIDVQYSFSFQKYGDIRLDIVSAGEIKDNELNRLQVQKRVVSSPEPNIMTDLNKYIEINKKGKYLDFRKNKMEGVLYFLHNKNKPSKKPRLSEIKDSKIDCILYLPTRVIVEELVNNWNIVKRNFKINDKSKNQLKDKHISSFVCLNVKYLSRKYNDVLLFKNRESLKNSFRLPETPFYLEQKNKKRVEKKSYSLDYRIT